MNDDMLNWDDGLEASEEREFTLLPVGEYEFIVAKFEKAISKAGSNMAVLTLDVQSDDGHYPIFDRLVLTTKMQWKLSQFFECIGLQKKGEPLKKMPWSKIVGVEGRIKIAHDTYNGNTRAVVDKYLPPVGETKKAKKEIEDDDLPFEL